MQEGENARVGHKEINSMRTVVVASSYESEEKSKDGIEYEQNTFLETFKDHPDVIKKAKYPPLRFGIQKPRHLKLNSEQRFTSWQTECTASKKNQAPISDRIVPLMMALCLWWKISSDSTMSWRCRTNSNMLVALVA